MSWHVGRNGEVFGPFSFDILQEAIVVGELFPSDLIWTDGMPDWLPASSVPGLWMPPPLPEPKAPLQSELPLDASPDGVRNDISAAPRGRNVFVRHWRGDLSLGVSYWAIGFAVGMVTLIASGIFQSAISAEGIEPRSAGLLLAGFLVFLAALTVWQVTGVWRSASNHRARGGKAGWAYLAKLMVVVAVVKTAADVNNLWPVMLQSFALVTAVDDTPPYNFRLLRDGTEIELSGGMKAGAANELRRLLDAAPTVTLVHLNSVGGRLSEGYALAQLIRSRKLSTYTSSTCVSACTLAFIAGQRRLLAKGASIGFHSASIGKFDIKDLPDINTEMRSTLREHGVPEWFIEKAVTTPAASMWYPDFQQLIDAKIVTALVDRRDFGTSYTKPVELSDVEEALSQYPVYRSLKAYDVQTYNKLVARLHDGMRAGRSMAETTQALQTIFRSEVLPKYIAVAPDQTIKAYWQTQLDELIELKSQDPRLCVAFAYPGAFDIDAQRYISKEVRARDLAALGNLIEAAVRTPKRGGEVDVDVDLDRIRKAVARKFPGSLDAMSNASSASRNPQLACDGLIEFNSQLLRMPLSRAGTLMRYLGKSSE